jgi:hypothetical protein
MARFYLCENPRMRCKKICKSSLHQCAKDGVAPPSVFYLPCSCEHQIHTHTWQLLPFFLAATVLILFASDAVVPPGGAEGLQRGLSQEPGQVCHGRVDPTPHHMTHSIRPSIALFLVGCPPSTL